MIIRLNIHLLKLITIFIFKIKILLIYSFSIKLYNNNIKICLQNYNILN